MSTPSPRISTAPNPPAQRVAVYIDGLNLYYGLRDAGWQRHCWLDLWNMSENLLRAGQRLVSVKYFTARFLKRAGDGWKYTPQIAYLQALETLPVQIQYGYHQPKRLTCPRCGAVRETFEEKMTDVNIAAALLGDAYGDAYDTAILISGDNDLAGPVEVIRRQFARKRVVAAFPPRRYSPQLAAAAAAHIFIGRSKVRDSQLPAQVVKSDGHIIARPPQWS